MNTLLVLTVGQTDVQIVLGDARHELPKDRCAALHDQIERRGYVLCEAPVPKGEPVKELPEGKLKLCTPKLDAILREVVPTAALVLETRRDADSAPGDPRLAGAVLEARLKAKGVESVFRRAYLKGAERLEDPNDPRDEVIRREVADRLDEAVRTTVSAVKPSRVVVAATGGFPAVSRLVEEIVGLHARSSEAVELLKVHDGSQESPPTADRAIRRTLVPEPVVSFQTRRRVLELIDKGNLLGAWAVAEPLHNDDTEREWTKVIEWLACFASSRPIPEECDIAVLKHRRMAVRAALRVELALRSQNIPRAIHGTVSFFEAALWDHLNERAVRHPNRRLFRFKDGQEPREQREKLFRKHDCSEEDRRRPFELIEEDPNGVRWHRIYDDDACAGRIAKYYLKKKALHTICARISTIRDLRNDVAHNEPTPEVMENAQKKMADAGLWSETGRFLTQEIVQDVLKELGVEDPSRLCADLIKIVRQRLLAHRLGRNKAND